MRNWQKWLWLAPLTILMLNGCATRPERPSPPPQEPAVEEPLPPAEDVPPEAPVAPPQFNPRAFLGMTPDEMERRLGQPDLVRREGQARVWQYVSGPCVLHFFLYPAATPAGDTIERVEHVEAKTRPGPWGEGLNAETACAGEFKSR